MARIVEVKASFELWQQIITTGWTVPGARANKIECVEGLPEGAKLAHIRYDQPLDTPKGVVGVLIFTFSHDSFDEVEDGDLIPTINPIFKEHYKD